MSDEQNKFYVQLLYDHPEKLVNELQPFIRKAVANFGTSGFFRRDEYDDVVQSINEKLLTQKIDKMRKQYNHSVYFLTYFTRILTRMCLETVRAAKSKKKHIVRATDGDLDVPTQDIDYLDDLIIRDEAKRLNYFLRLHFNDCPKLKICLKAYTRYPMTLAEIEKELNIPLQEKFYQMVDYFEHDYGNATDKEIYEKLGAIFNHWRKKSITPDALRKWTDNRIDKIIEMLNSKVNREKPSNFSRETLKILLQKYFELNQEKMIF